MTHHIFCWKFVSDQIYFHYNVLLRIFLLLFHVPSPLGRPALIMEFRASDATGLNKLRVNHVFSCSAEMCAFCHVFPHFVSSPDDQLLYVMLLFLQSQNFNCVQCFISLSQSSKHVHICNPAYPAQTQNISICPHFECFQSVHNIFP